MKIVGLITEYNPFHNGHEYHIKKAREVSGADAVIVVMSGNFVQRGAPAITDKYTRTRMALRCGADIVLELPTTFATSSAEHFALGSIALLENTGIVDSICFGSESGDLHEMQKLADLFSKEPPEFQQMLQEGLRKGDTYPKARSTAAIQYLNLSDESTTHGLLTMPNNILAMEYCKALKFLNSSIQPYAIKRIGSGYHEQNIGVFSSASGLRESFLGKNDLDKLEQGIPAPAFSELKSSLNVSFPIQENDFSEMLFYALSTKTFGDLVEIKDMTEDLANRILTLLPEYTGFQDFSLLLKSKQMTLTRINRVLTHILLGIRKTPLSDTASFAPYIRVLGIKSSASPLINQIKEQKKKGVTLITKVAAHENSLSEKGHILFDTDKLAADLYRQVCYKKYHTVLPNEYRQPFIVL